MVAPPAATAAATSLDTSQENTHEKLDGHDSGAPSSVSPLAASTTLPRDSTQVNQNIRDDDEGSEPENDEKDDSAHPKTAKLKIGTFVIKEFDNISCVGAFAQWFMHRTHFVILFCFLRLVLKRILMKMR